MKSVFFSAVVVFFSLAARGQAGSGDPNFLVGQAANNTVRNISVDSNDRIYITGEFTQFKGGASMRTVRLLPNGLVDATWVGSANGGVDGPVRGSALQPNKRLLIGGLFNQVQGTARKNLARLDSNGALDPSFTVGLGPNNEVTDISEANGRIGISGYFSQYNGTAVPTFAVLNSSGSLDPAFSYPTNGVVSRCILVRPNQQVYLGGSFTFFGSTAVGRLVRLLPNGQMDPTFQVGAGFNGPVDVLYEQPDGKLLVGGSFTSYQGAPVGRIARLLPNGSLDPTWVVGVGASSTVRALSMDSQGRILVGGQFLYFNGSYVLYVTRLMPNGTLDNTFSTGMGLNGTVEALAHQSDGKMLVGGNFTLFQTTTVVGRLVRLLTNPCVPATAPVLTQISGGKCPGDSVTLAVVGGALVQSTQWTWYSGGCGSNPVGTGSQWKGLISQPDTLWVRGTGACMGPCSFILVQPPLDTAAPVPLVSQLPTLTGLCQVALPAPPYAVDSCSGTVVGTTTGPALFTTPGTHYIDWTFTDASGNASQQIQQCVVYGLANTVLVDSTTLPQATLLSSHNSPQAVYQWLRCDSNFAPALGGNVRYWMPKGPGIYAVRVEEEGCVDTSQCIVYTYQNIGLVERSLQRAAVPWNQESAFLFIPQDGNGAGNLRIIDGWGRTIDTIRLESDQREFMWKHPAGVYIFQWISDSGHPLSSFGAVYSMN
jgi:uncharacterized delta-60 repeat protein